jgi:membrane fusion protein (multidrug efflux system)
VAVAKVEVRDVPVEVRAPVDLRPLVQADVLALVRPSDLPDQLEAARVAFELAKANKDRAEKLAPTGVVSEQELQGAQTQYQATSAQLAALGVRLGETRITSPLDGVVSQRRLDPGVLVGPNAGTGPILQVQRVDVLRVFVPVNERDAAGVRLGLTAHLEFDALSGKRFTGTVVRVSPGFDPVARTLDAEVHLKNPGDLRPGMYGRGAIVTEVHKDALVVTVAAVQISDQRTFVYVVQGDKVRRVEVKTGVDGGEWLEILSGLSGSDEVVTAGTDVLSDGSAIRPVRGVDPFSGAAASAAKGPQ